MKRQRPVLNGLKHGRKLLDLYSDGIVQQIDLMPTILDLAGVAPPPGVQGRSQRSVLTSELEDTGNQSALIESGVSGVSLPGAPVYDGSMPDLWKLRSREWRMSYSPDQAMVNCMT